MNALSAQYAAITVNAFTAQNVALTVNMLTAQNATLNTENASLKSTNESLATEVAQLRQQLENHTRPPAGTATIPDVVSIDMNAIMNLDARQLKTLDVGLRLVRARILNETRADALCLLVELEVPALLASVGIRMDLEVWAVDGWSFFCDRENPSQARWHNLCGYRRMNVDHMASWVSYAMVISLDVMDKLCRWRNIS